eukprot:gene3417-6874_t
MIGSSPNAAWRSPQHAQLARLLLLAGEARVEVAMEGQQPAQAADGNRKFAKCRECGRKGHYARECPSLKKREPAEP